MANSSIVLKFKIVEHVIDIDENCRNVCFEGTVLNQYSTFNLATQRGIWAQIFILIYLDVANNFTHGHFTSKVIFQFVKLDIIVFDFVGSIDKVTNY